MKLDLQYFANDSSDDKKAEFLAELSAGNINVNQRWNKQKEHIEGTKENVTRVANQLASGQTPASVFYETVDIEELFTTYSGKGEIVFRKNQSYPIEYVDTEGVVGKVYNVGKSEYVESNRIGIQYSSKGYHIYPVKGW